MKALEVGDILIAEHYCGFPDRTTAGKEYEVTSVTTLYDGRSHFYIKNDAGVEVFPISTQFKRKDGESK